MPDKVLKFLVREVHVLRADMHFCHAVLTAPGTTSFSQRTRRRAGGSQQCSRAAYTAERISMGRRSVSEGPI